MTGFKIDAAALRLITSRAKMVVERKTRKSIPILQTVLIEWAKGVLRAEATDLDISIICAADAETDGVGKVAINVDHLNWIARAAEDAGAVVEVETLLPADKRGPERIKVSAGEISATMNLINSISDFPEMVMGDDMQGPIGFSPPELHRLLTMGRSAISTEETRYYLNGTFLHGINGKARAVSTDGRRMAVIDSEAPWWTVGTKPAWRREIKRMEGDPALYADYGIIIPTKTVGIIAHLVDPRGNEPVMLQISETKLHAIGPRWEIKAKVIDGTYPSYERVIPQDEPKAHMTLALASLRRIAQSPFMDGRSGAMKFELGNSRATMKSVEIGEISAPITSTGDFDICFNSRYVVDTARALGGVVRFDMTKSGDPARVYGEDPAAMFVLMPMRV